MWWWGSIYENLTSNSTIRRKLQLKHARHKQLQVKDRKCFFMDKKRMKKKKKSSPPCLYKNVKYDSKVKEAHFKTVKNHSDRQSYKYFTQNVFFYTPSLKLLEMNIS